MALAKAGVELFQEGRLLGGDRDRLSRIGRLQRQPALDPRPQAVVVEDLLDGDRGDPRALERQRRLMAIAAIPRMLQRQRLDPLHNRLRRRPRMALVDRRRVFQPLEALRLESPFPLVETRPVQPALPACLRALAPVSTGHLGIGREA